MPTSRVVALRTRPDAVRADLLRLVALAALPDALDPAAPTLLVAQSGEAPVPGERSTPWQAAGVAIALQRRGFEVIRATWSDPPPPTNAPARRALRDLGVDDGGPPTPSLPYKPLARMRALPRGLPDGIALCPRAVGHNLAVLPVQRADRRTALAGAMHGVAHALLGRSLHAVAPWNADALVDALAISAEVCRGRVAVLDATMVPLDARRSLDAGYLLASTDLVALDAVAASLMGYDPMRIRHLRHAHDDRLGVADLGDIEVVGDELSHARWSPRAHPHRPPSPAAAAFARVAAHTPLPAFTAELRQTIFGPLRREEALTARWRETRWGACYDATEGAAAPET